MAENRCIHTDCEGFYRRDFLKAGALGLFGLSLTDLFRLKAQAATAEAPVGVRSPNPYGRGDLVPTRSKQSRFYQTHVSYYLVS